MLGALLLSAVACEPAGDDGGAGGAGSATVLENPSNLEIVIERELVLADDVLSLYQHPAVEAVELSALTITLVIKSGETLALPPSGVLVGDAQGGFMRRIVGPAPELATGSVVLETRPALLTELFVDGHFRIEGPVQDLQEEPSGADVSAFNEDADVLAGL